MNERIYSNITEVIEVIRSTGPKIELEENDKGEILLQDYRSVDGTIRAVPYPPSPYLYRGQTDRIIPCLPKLYRNISQNVSHPRELPRNQLLEYLLNIAKLREFDAALRNHPHGRIKNRSIIYIEQTALAQHYGISTNYLDLTQSLKIASFFATCAPICKKTGEIEWIPKQSGKGIIYRFNLTLYENYYKFFVPLALPFFKRPYVQRAWACCTTYGIDFESTPGLETYEFKHKLIESEKILKYFKNGEILFPRDTVAKIAQVINNSQDINILAIKEAMMHSGILDKMLNNLANKYSKAIENRFNVNISDSSSQFVCTVEDWESLLKEEEEFFNSLKSIDASVISDVIKGKLSPENLPGLKRNT